MQARVPGHGCRTIARTVAARAGTVVGPVPNLGGGLPGGCRSSRRPVAAAALSSSTVTSRRWALPPRNPRPVSAASRGLCPFLPVLHPRRGILSCPTPGPGPARPGPAGSYISSHFRQPALQRPLPLATLLHGQRDCYYCIDSLVQYLVESKQAPGQIW
jgi:hypothetical protein